VRGVPEALRPEARRASEAGVRREEKRREEKRRVFLVLGVLFIFSSIRAADDADDADADASIVKRKRTP
jgi:hypothetical protein